MRASRGHGTWGRIGDVSLMAPSPADAARRSGLRRMRLVALSLLLLAAVVFLLTLRLDHDGVWGYVNTAAEAAMVGALADWFAVTALFRHPLGLPDPAHGDHPQAQERDRPQPPGVRHRELPDRGDRPRAAGRRPASGSAWGSGSGVPEHRRRITYGGRAGRPGRAGPALRRRGARPRRGLPRAAPRAGAGGARSPARCSRGSSTSRPTTGSSTSVSNSCASGSRTTPARMPRCSASGRRGGRRRGSTTR